MVEEIPDAITSNEDDTQGVNLDLDELVRKFINPIEQIRSVSAPNLLSPSETEQEDLDRTEVNLSEPQESRAHAFYRMLGLPVMAEDGSFYNPGFNRKPTSESKTYKKSIIQKIPDNVQDMQRAREYSVRNRLSYFKKGGVNATLYTLALGVFDGVKRFQIMEPSGSFDFLDPQVFTQNARYVYISSNYKYSDGSDIEPQPSFYYAGSSTPQIGQTCSHQIRPMTVDPVIDRTVRPPNRLICQPFLISRPDTRLEPNVYLDRPGIEFIIRLRLRQQLDENGFSRNVVQALDPAQLTEAQREELEQLASALLDQENIRDEEIEKLLARSAVELLTVNKFVKLLKGLVDILIDSLELITKNAKIINWVPIASEKGPEYGTENGTFIKPQRKTELDQRIGRLKIKKRNAQIKETISDRDDIKPEYFAISEFQSTGKTYNKEIQKQQTKSKNLEQKSAAALRRIELITGEVSGLGLIDIIAIYTALWYIPIDTLISLLDDSAFERLVATDDSGNAYNPDLMSDEVEERKLRPHPWRLEHPGREAMDILEKQVINLLSFADQLFNDKRKPQKRTTEGSPAGS